jgi:hypothetical protein
MPHPMHHHGFRFGVLERGNSPGQVAGTAVDERGRTATDLGWKDTLLIWPGETVRIAIEVSHDFEAEQLYLFHCHILEHEDAGMMINYKVVDPHGPEPLRRMRLRRLARAPAIAHPTSARPSRPRPPSGARRSRRR